MPLNFLLLKAKIDATGLSEASFARLHGFSQKSINTFANGKRTCHLWNAMQLADALHCPLEEIWTGKITDDERAYAERKLASKGYKLRRSEQLNEEDENFITADLAKKIYDKAFERAKTRRELLLERIKEQIRKEYRDFTDEQCLELIRAIPNETISRIFILAEISRMNSSISFLAGKSEEGADA